MLSNQVGKNGAPPADRSLASREEFERLKDSLHTQLVQALEIRVSERMDSERFTRELRPLTKEFCQRRAAHLNESDLNRLVEALMAEMVGLGPLEPLLQDTEISDILVNGYRDVFIEREGRLERTDVRFTDNDHLLRTIQRIVARVGRRVDEASPMVDARLADGSRVNAIIPPLSLEGPKLSIRRFGARPLDLERLIGKASLLPEMAEFLRAAIEARVSFLISGGTGAGKTTLLNALSAYVPADERLVTIEDSAELRLHHRHVVSLETRPANSEGTGGVPPRELLRNSLRMRPDRIIVGEVRGPEAMDMLQAMNSGHEGSLTTIHANDVDDALSRLEMMVGMAGFDFPVPVVRQYIVAGIRLLVHVSRLKGGPRRVTRIAEITGLAGGEYQLEDIFGFEQLGVDAAGTAFGEFFVTGYKPRCLKRFMAAGIHLPESLFNARRVPTAGWEIDSTAQDDAGSDDATVGDVTAENLAAEDVTVDGVIADDAAIADAVTIEAGSNHAKSKAALSDTVTANQTANDGTPGKHDPKTIASVSHVDSILAAMQQW